MTPKYTALVSPLLLERDPEQFYTRGPMHADEADNYYLALRSKGYVTSGDIKEITDVLHQRAAAVPGGELSVVVNPPYDPHALAPHNMARQRAPATCPREKDLVDRPRTYVKDGMSVLRHPPGVSIVVIGLGMTAGLWRELHPSTRHFEFYRVSTAGVTHIEYGADVWSQCTILQRQEGLGEPLEEYAINCVTCPHRGAACVGSAVIAKSRAEGDETAEGWQRMREAPSRARNVLSRLANLLATDLDGGLELISIDMAWEAAMGKPKVPRFSADLPEELSKSLRGARGGNNACLSLEPRDIMAAKFARSQTSAKGVRTRKLRRQVCGHGNAMCPLASVCDRYATTCTYDGDVSSIPDQIRRFDAGLGAQDLEALHLLSRIGAKADGSMGRLGLLTSRAGNAISVYAAVVYTPENGFHVALTRSHHYVRNYTYDTAITPQALLTALKANPAMALCRDGECLLAGEAVPPFSILKPDPFWERYTERDHDGNALLRWAQAELVRAVCGDDWTPQKRVPVLWATSVPTAQISKVGVTVSLRTRGKVRTKYIPYKETLTTEEMLAGVLTVLELVKAVSSNEWFSYVTL